MKGTSHSKMLKMKPEPVHLQETSAILPLMILTLLYVLYFTLHPRVLGAISLQGLLRVSWPFKLTWVPSTFPAQSIFKADAPPGG